MKKTKRTKLIAEAVRSGRLDAEIRRSFRYMTYWTIDLVTGDTPVMLAIPVDAASFEETGHLRIDLPKWGFRIVKVGHTIDLEA